MFSLLQAYHRIGLDAGSLCMRVAIYCPRITDLIIYGGGGGTILKLHTFRDVIKSSPIPNLDTCIQVTQVTQ
jgi:hypothetical protein